MRPGVYHDGPFAQGCGGAPGSPNGDTARGRRRCCAPAQKRSGRRPGRVRTKVRPGLPRNTRPARSVGILLRPATAIASGQWPRPSLGILLATGRVDQPAAAARLRVFLQAFWAVGVADQMGDLLSDGEDLGHDLSLSLERTSRVDWRNSSPVPRQPACHSGAHEKPVNWEPGRDHVGRPRPRRRGTRARLVRQLSLFPRIGDGTRLAVHRHRPWRTAISIRHPAVRNQRRPCPWQRSR